MARTDTERLDWLNRNYNPEEVFPTEGDFDNIRDAIDAALDEESVVANAPKPEITMRIASIIPYKVDDIGRAAWVFEVVGHPVYDGLRVVRDKLYGLTNLTWTRAGYPHIHETVPQDVIARANSLIHQWLKDTFEQ